MSSYEPTSDELFAYKQLFQHATKGAKATIGGADAVNFFLKSGLPVPTLKQVWALASNGKSEMGPPEFSCAMRLLALAQAGHPVDAATLDKTRGVVLPPPTFQGVEIQRAPAAPAATTPTPASAAAAAAGGSPPRSLGERKSSQGKMAAAGQWAINAEAAKNYAKIWGQQQKNAAGLIEGKDAAAFFMRSGQSRETLRAIWQMCDVGGDGALDEVEFYVGMHLTMMCKRGAQLPDALPAELLQSARANVSGTGASSSSTLQKQNSASAYSSNLGTSGLGLDTSAIGGPSSYDAPYSSPAALPTPVPVPVPVAAAAPAPAPQNDEAIASATRGVLAADAAVQRLSAQAGVEAARLRAERDSTLAALQDANRQFQANVDRLRELDAEVARLRDEVGSLRSQLDARRAAVAAQQDEMVAKVGEARAVIKSAAGAGVGVGAAEPLQKRRTAPLPPGDPLDELGVGPSPGAAAGAAGGNAFEAFDFGAPSGSTPTAGGAPPPPGIGGPGAGAGAGAW